MTFIMHKLVVALLELYMSQYTQGCKMKYTSIQRTPLKNGQMSLIHYSDVPLQQPILNSDTKYHKYCTIL